VPRLKLPSGRHERTNLFEYYTRGTAAKFLAFVPSGCVADLRLNDVAPCITPSDAYPPFHLSALSSPGTAPALDIVSHSHDQRPSIAASVSNMPLGNLSFTFDS
jgi:hypothetical protein